MSDSANDPIENSEESPESSDVDQNAGDAAESTEEREPRPRVFGKHAFLILAVPYIIFLAGNSIGAYLDQIRLTPHGAGDHLPPELVEKIEEDAKEKEKWYPISYTVVISLTTLFVLAVGRGYFRDPFKVSGLAFVVGFVGIFVWLGLWWLDKNFLGIGTLLGQYVGGRKAFNPIDEMSENPSWMYAFLAIRFFGLVLIVPIIEEFFLRGFLMRYIDDPDWDEIPIGVAGKGALIGVVVYALVSHPVEPLAAVAWFGMVTWLYLRTKSIWDCVIAHAVTNLLLGIYVLTTKTWELW